MNKIQPFSAVSYLPLRLFLVVFLAAHFSSIFAQGCDTPFFRQIGSNGISEKAYKITSLPDGNLLVGGNKQNASLLMMVTPNGEIVWERTFDFTAGADFIYDMLIDSEGKLVAVGRDQLNTNTINFIFRYDYQTNQLLWSRRMTDPAYTRFDGLLELPNHNILTYGTTQHSGNLDNLMIEVNRIDGSVAWMKSYNNGSTDVFNDAIIKGNAIYTANVQRYSSAFDKIRAAVSKLELNGTQVWTRNYIKNQTAVARTYSSAITSVNDTLVVFGHGNLTAPEEYGYTLQLYTTDLNGNIHWAKQYILPGSSQIASKIIPLPDGYLLQGVFTQAFRTEAFLMKVNKQGTIIWAKTIGGPEDETTRSIVLHNGHIFIAGHTSGVDANQDIFLGKLTMDGEVNGVGCSFVEAISVTTNTLSSPYDGQHNMLNAASNHLLTSFSSSAVSVASPIYDIGGCGCVPIGACSNLLVNAGFENGITGWSVTGDVTTTSDSYSGLNAAKICGTSPGSVGQLYTAQAGETFTASMWAKSDTGPNNANAQLRFMNSSFTPLPTGSDQQYIYSNVYEPYFLNAVAPPGTAYVHFMIWKQGNACAFMDNMELCKDGNPVVFPDLAVNGTAVLNSPMPQGSTMSIEYTLSNIGAAAVNGSYNVKMYASTSNVLNQNSVLLANYQQQNTPVGYSANLTAAPTLPASLLPGNYYLITIADKDLAIQESNESNNTAVTPFTISPPPPAQPDLTLSNLTAPASISAGTGSFTFTIQNIGTGAVQGNYQIGSFLSTDNVLSADDYALATIAEQNTAIGSFARTGSFSLPIGFATGNYFLIVKADVGSAIAEGNENNNTVSRPITVTGLVCNGDVTLSSQAEVDAFSGCTIIEGDLFIQPPFGATTSDITDLSPLLSITQINGGLVVATNRNLPNLHGLENITAANRLVVTLCDELQSLNELSNLESELDDIFIMTNPGLLNLNGLENIKATNGYFIISDNNALLNLDALSNQVIAGKVQINNNAAINSVSGLANLTTVQSDFIISNCDALQNLNGLQNLTSVGGGLAIASNELLQDVSAVSNLTSVGGFFSVANNSMLSDCCIFTDLLNSNAIGGTISINNNLPGCNSKPEIIADCTPVGGSIDLSLTVTSPATAPIYTSYPTVIKVTNSGSLPATGVKVVCQKPNGVVYTGGNEFTTSQGTFGPLTGQEWVVGTLAPGATATLTVNYFLLQSNLPTVYAQVTAANETDPDSTPNNGTPPTPNEDDEASSTGTPPPPPPAQPDLTLSNLTAPASISPGLGNFTFTLQNIGTGAVQGNYQIGSFLSTDNVLSANDYAFATIPEQNTAVGSFSRTGSYTLPTGFVPGNYYLIVKTDVIGAIAEGNENNNTVSRPIAVTGLVCNGDMILESQAEVDAFSGCNVIEGDLIIRSPNGNTGASSDINDLGPLTSISSINGNLLIENNDLLTDLQGLNQVVHLGSLVITHCDNLDNIQALSGITGSLGNFVSWDNASLSNIGALAGISTINQTFSIIRNASLTNLNGLSNISSVGGSFEINENTALADIQGLSGLSEIGKDFLIANNNMLTSLNGLENLTSVGLGFVLAANEELSDASALSTLTSVGGNFYVALNHNLADCCVFNHLLTSNAITGTITINDNAGNCNSLISIIDNCTPQGVDLQLAMSASNLSPGIYTSFPVQLTITNAGGEAATGVVVHFPKPVGVVYEGGNEFTLTKGGFNAFGNERWFIGDLAAGESATLTVRYFLLTSNALKPFAQVFACTETDADSAPNNGTAPNPTEDDEATVTINAFAGNSGGNSLVFKDNRQRLNFDRIFPNPAQYMVTLDLRSRVDQPATLDFYNQQGQLVQTMSVQLEHGQNLVDVFVSDWKSGTYNVIARGEESALPAYGRFLKVWEE